MDREEYGTGTAVSSEHLRGQFGAKCVSWVLLRHSLSAENPENDNFNFQLHYVLF